MPSLDCCGCVCADAPVLDICWNMRCLIWLCTLQTFVYDQASPRESEAFTAVLSSVCCSRCLLVGKLTGGSDRLFESKLALVLQLASQAQASCCCSHTDCMEGCFAD